MASISDFNKLSTYVNGIIERRVRSLTLGLTTLTVKLKSFQTGSNANGSWEKRPNVLEQVGNINQSSADEIVVMVTFPVPMPDTDYTVSLIGFTNPERAAADAWPQLIKSTKTVNNFQVKYQRVAGGTEALDGFEWRAIRITA